MARRNQERESHLPLKTAIEDLEKFWDNVSKERHAVRPPGSMTAQEFMKKANYADERSAHRKLRSLLDRGMVTKSSAVAENGRMVIVYTPVIK